MITKSQFAMILSAIALVGGMFTCLVVMMTNTNFKTEYYNIGNGIQATSDIEHGVVCYKTFFSVSCVKVLEGERE